MSDSKEGKQPTPAADETTVCDSPRDSVRWRDSSHETHAHISYLQLSKGDRVEARFRGNPRKRMYAGVIAAVHRARDWSSGGWKYTYDVDYDDGDKDRGLAAEHVKKLASSTGDARDGGDDEPASGTRASSRGGRSSPRGSGRSGGDGDGDADADGDKPADDGPLAKGDRVEARFRGNPRKRMYAGVIAAVHRARDWSSGGWKYTYDVDYDDGDKDRGLAAEHVKKLASSTGDASNADMPASSGRAVASRSPVSRTGRASRTILEAVGEASNSSSSSDADDQSSHGEWWGACFGSSSAPAPFNFVQVSAGSSTARLHACVFADAVALIVQGMLLACPSARQIKRAEGSDRLAAAEKQLATELAGAASRSNVTVPAAQTAVNDLLKNMDVPSKLSTAELQSMWSMTLASGPAPAKALASIVLGSAQSGAARHDDKVSDILARLGKHEAHMLQSKDEYVGLRGACMLAEWEELRGTGSERSGSTLSRICGLIKSQSLLSTLKLDMKANQRPASLLKSEVQDLASAFTVEVQGSSYVDYLALHRAVRASMLLNTDDEQVDAMRPKESVGPVALALISTFITIAGNDSVDDAALSAFARRACPTGLRVQQIPLWLVAVGCAPASLRTLGAWQREVLPQSGVTKVSYSQMLQALQAEPTPQTPPEAETPLLEEPADVPVEAPRQRAKRPGQAGRRYSSADSENDDERPSSASRSRGTAVSSERRKPADKPPRMPVGDSDDASVGRPDLSTPKGQRAAATNFAPATPAEAIAAIDTLRASLLSGLGMSPAAFGPASSAFASPSHPAARLAHAPPALPADAAGVSAELRGRGMPRLVRELAAVREDALHTVWQAYCSAQAAGEAPVEDGEPSMKPVKAWVLRRLVVRADGDGMLSRAAMESALARLGLQLATREVRALRSAFRDRSGQAGAPARIEPGDVATLVAGKASAAVSLLQGVAAQEQARQRAPAAPDAKLAQSSAQSSAPQMRAAASALSASLDKLGTTPGTLGGWLATHATPLERGHLAQFMAMLSDFQGSTGIAPHQVGAPGASDVIRATGSAAAAGSSIVLPLGPRLKVTLQVHVDDE